MSGGPGCGSSRTWQSGESSPEGQQGAQWGKHRGGLSVSGKMGNKRLVGVSNQEPQPKMFLHEPSQQTFTHCHYASDVVSDFGEFSVITSIYRVPAACHQYSSYLHGLIFYLTTARSGVKLFPGCKRGNRESRQISILKGEH